MRALCIVIIDLILLMQLQLTLTVFLLKILCSLWFAGSCVSMGSRQLRAMFVVTFLLKGGQTK